MLKLYLFQEQEDVLMALSLQSTGGSTNTQDALRLVRDQIFVERNGDRDGVPNKLVIVTDGGGNVRPENTVVEAYKLKVGGYSTRLTESEQRYR